VKKLSKIDLAISCEKIKRDGYVVLKSVYSENKIKEALKLIELYYDKSHLWVGVPNRDSKDKRVYNLASKSKFFVDFIFEENLLSILHIFLQDPYYRWLPEGFYNFILNSSSARSSGEFLELHIDSGIPFRGEVPLGIVVITSLEKTTKENGATIAIKGTHQSGNYTDRTRKDYEVLEIDPGDVIMMDSRTWHGSGSNIVGGSRWTINTHFTQWFIKQDIDLPRSIDGELFKIISDQDKILLGFCSMSSPGADVRVNIKTGLNHLESKEVVGLIN
jgi:hypothetical protein